MESPDKESSELELELEPEPIRGLEDVFSEALPLETLSASTSNAEVPDFLLSKGMDGKRMSNTDVGIDNGDKNPIFRGRAVTCLVKTWGYTLGGKLTQRAVAGCKE